LTRTPCWGRHVNLGRDGRGHAGVASADVEVRTYGLPATASARPVQWCLCGSVKCRVPDSRHLHEQPDTLIANFARALERHHTGQPFERTSQTCAQFADATRSFLRENVPRSSADFCDSVTAHFRVINPKDLGSGRERGIYQGKAGRQRTAYCSAPLGGFRGNPAVCYRLRHSKVHLGIVG
jgi:hypothetical protein